MKIAEIREMLRQENRWKIKVRFHNRLWPLKQYIAQERRRIRQHMREHHQRKVMAWCDHDYDKSYDWGTRWQEYECVVCGNQKVERVMPRPSNTGPAEWVGDVLCNRPMVGPK